MTITRTDLAELAVFAAVARHRSFSRAALELGVSASALSHSLKGLESRLGIRLLNRSTRAVVPTDAGERLLTQLLPTLGQLEEALEELTRHGDEPVGRLKICAPRAAIQEVLAPVLIDYLVRYPRMQVEVVEQELMPRLIEDGYDAALFYGDTVITPAISVLSAIEGIKLVTPALDDYVLTAKATYQGSLQGKLPIYDAGGTLLGYIPIYSTKS